MAQHRRNVSPMPCTHTMAEGRGLPHQTAMLPLWCQVIAAPLTALTGMMMSCRSCCACCGRCCTAGSGPQTIVVSCLGLHCCC
jgi:hypothetical protein